MRIIKRLAEDIECNLREAEDKIQTAYSLKTEHPAEANWYRDMAVAHLGFNKTGHDLVSMEISTYRDSDEYKTHPEYADGMRAVWEDKHSDIIAHTARVRSMVDSFK